MINRTAGSRRISVIYINLVYQVSNVCVQNGIGLFGNVRVRQGLAQQLERRVLDVEVVQLTDRSTQIWSLDQWQSAAQRKQHDAPDLRPLTKDTDS